jgi:predicted PurR-regulated permease PerM
MDTFGVMGMVFGIAGLVLGTLGLIFGLTAIRRVDKLESSLGREARRQD